MNETVLFFLLPPFADWEGADLAAFLSWPEADKPYDVKTVSLTKSPIKSIGNFTILPDYGIDEIPQDYAALILIGSDSWRTPGLEPVVELVQKTLTSGRLVGSICDSVAFLAKNGFLNERNHTGNDPQDISTYAGDAYTNHTGYQQANAVVDGLLVTASGSRPLAFAREILRLLEVEPEVSIQRWYDENAEGCN